MCGRFTQAYTWEQLVALYRLTMPPVNTQPSYNVCPTDQIDLILLGDAGGRAFARARWGLIPYWWSKPLKRHCHIKQVEGDSAALSGGLRYWNHSFRLPLPKQVITSKNTFP
jgi:putative SOS response-associated peptidase YedK